MTRRCLLAFLLTLACAQTWAATAGARIQVRLLAEPFPPLQYTDPSGAVRGIAYKLVGEALADLATRTPLDVVPLEFVPLKRALLVAASEPNVIVLSVARTPDRDTKYRWLGTVSPYELWLYRYKAHPLPPLKDVTELRGKGLHFGAQDGGNFHEWLRRQGLGTAPDNSVIDTVPQNALNFMKAQIGRIDLFAHPEISFAFRAKEHQMRAGDFERVMRIDELSTPLWAITGARTDERLVTLLRDSLQRLQQSGRAERIRQDCVKEFAALYELEESPR